MAELEKYIHQYLAGKLEGRALAIFESQMDSDPDFREKVEAARRWREEQLAKNQSENQVENQQVRREHPTTEKHLPKSNFNRNALIFIGLVIVGLGLYNRFFRPKGNFEKAFQLPESIVADAEFRYANDPDTVFLLNQNCSEMLTAADQFYKKQEFEKALEPLEIMLDSEIEDGACRSDALFYTALIRLQLKDPGEAVQSLGQIEDFSRFGDDIQWYMALAFVQMAERNPDREPHAVRALEKIIDSAQSEERKEWARQVLAKYQ